MSQEDLTREEIQAAASYSAAMTRRQGEEQTWTFGYEQGYRTGYLDARARYKTCDHRIEAECDLCPEEGADG